MSTADTPGCAQLSVDVTRYAFEELPEKDRPLIEGHLSKCPPCNKRVLFAKKLVARAKEELTPKDIPDEPCPDTSVILALEDDELDGETAQHVRAHLLFCKPCREEYLLLCRMRPEDSEVPALSKEIPARPEGRSVARPVRRWFANVQRMAHGIKCAEILGTGHLVMQPVVAILGEGEPPPRSISIEDLIVDPDSHISSTVRVVVEVDQDESTARLLLEARPPQSDWTACLLGSTGKELASVPISSEETMLGSELPLEAYDINIVKDGVELATYTVDIRPA